MIIKKEILGKFIINTIDSLSKQEYLDVVSANKQSRLTSNTDTVSIIAVSDIPNVHGIVLEDEYGSLHIHSRGSLTRLGICEGLLRTDLPEIDFTVNITGNRDDISVVTLEEATQSELEARLREIKG